MTGSVPRLQGPWSPALVARAPVVVSWSSREAERIGWNLWGMSCRDHGKIGGWCGKIGKDMELFVYLYDFICYMDKN